MFFFEDDESEDDSDRQEAQTSCHDYHQQIERTGRQVKLLQIRADADRDSNMEWRHHCDREWDGLADRLGNVEQQWEMLDDSNQDNFIQIIKLRKEIRRLYTMLISAVVILVFVLHLVLLYVSFFYLPLYEQLLCCV